jgi:undecaprenyl-diphosphatase
VPKQKYWIGVALAAALAFLLQAYWVLAGHSTAFDQEIRDAVHGWESPLATQALLTITMLGSELVMLPLGVVVVWRLAAAGRGRQAIGLAAAGLGAELVSQLLKLAFHRPRPPVFFELAPAETYSFPSGHAFAASAIYGLLAVGLIEMYPQRRTGIAAGAVLLALLLGFSRVYLGYHYPSDVLAGWTCALAWLALTGPPIHHAGQPGEPRH